MVHAYDSGCMRSHSHHNTEKRGKGSGRGKETADVLVCSSFRGPYVSENNPLQQH